eukprot:CAMPEP_0113617086 /NCGR_PEP_ID=MMETSP0017_2-20120614/8587_1 /TAXON_ID=2856 /ORGANISM="Cylindrotheca closterium" /LENGTH=132 /DNA_ID=CAMNT_0000526447 /DNA_START=65 /DNA_END=459 /DNA_ORIENTATION=- /assembly_acc=CAM_ASM_000147
MRLSSSLLLLAVGASAQFPGFPAPGGDSAPTGFNPGPIPIDAPITGVLPTDPSTSNGGSGSLPTVLPPAPATTGSDPSPLTGPPPLDTTGGGAPGGFTPPVGLPQAPATTGTDPSPLTGPPPLDTTGGGAPG